jgi:spore maturation protein CgeB
VRILFVWAAAVTATAEVSRGLRAALARLPDVEVTDFRTPRRLVYHGLALANSDRPDLADDIELVSRLACEGIVAEALHRRSDLVVVTAGGGIHPLGLELCNRAGLPVAVVFTESPYEDDQQAVFARHCGHHFTNDRLSARERGWTYLPAAFDPRVWRPVEPDPALACDVLLSGTGWAERQAFLEQVDWTGIDLRLRGTWPGITKSSPLWPHYEQDRRAYEGAELAVQVASAKICLNFHRAHPRAESLNPRAYELAGCGACQVSDERPELSEVFGDAVPTFRAPGELGRIVRGLLVDDRWRNELADRQRRYVLAGGHTFDDRARVLLETITQRPLAAVAGGTR